MTQTQASPCRLLITAGPTQEPLDAVRFIGNRSSGRMGIALAAAAVERGHPTTLLLGPTPLAPPECVPTQAATIDPPRLLVERFRTTADLRAALARHWPGHDILIMAAAVADYRPVPASRIGADVKIARRPENLTIELEPTEDLVAEAAAHARPDQAIVGFALEPAETMNDAARRKLSAKGLHAIVANPLGTMDSHHVSAALHLASGPTRTAPADMTKDAFAGWLLDQLDAVRAQASTP